MRREARYLILAILVFYISKLQAQDLTINQVTREVLSGSPEIQQAHSKAEEFSWKKVEANSSLLPKIQLDANYLTNHRYAYIDVDFGSNLVTVPQIVPTSSVNLQARWLLFDGLASSQQRLSARLQENAAAKQLEWTQFQVRQNVTLLFYKALGTKILKEVAAQNLKTLQDHLNDVRLFQKAGASTKFDVLRVEVQVSEAQSELLNSQDNEVLSKSLLAEAMGRETEERELSGQLPTLKADIVSNLASANVEEKADLVALRLKSEAMTSQASAAGRFWAPKLNLFGQYQKYNNRNDRFDDYESYREAYQVGLNFSWELFDGFSSYAKSREVSEQKYQSEKQLQMTRLKSKHDLELWRRKFIYYCSIHKSRVSDVAKAEESVRLAKEGRRVGARTNTDLLDAESELFRAKAGQVNAQIGAIESLINLELSIGRKLYEFN